MSNQAKDWQEGSYTVLVDGKTIAVSKKVKVEKNKLGFPTYKYVTATTQCSPEDEFSLSMGVALAMDRLNKKLDKGKIEVGDKVKIKDRLLSYTVPIRWIKKNLDSVELAVCFAYGQIPDEDDTVYVVKVIAPGYIESQEEENNRLAYIQRYFKFSDGRISDNESCYLIDINGLEKV